MAKFGRRTFLKLGGAALVTAVGAPLFIPSDRLDFGVPRAVSTETLTSGEIQTLWGRYVERFDGLQQRATQQIAGQVPMLLLHDEFMMGHGGKLAAGSRLLVSQSTSNCWLAYGIAVPDRGHPQYGQPLPERRNPDERGFYSPQTTTRLWSDFTLDPDERGFAWVPSNPELMRNTFSYSEEISATVPMPGPRYPESQEMGRIMRAELQRVRQTSGGVLVMNGAG